MKNKRHQLDEEDKEILSKVKNEITYAIEQLQNRNLRNENIEIELIWHIKKTLKGE